MKRKISLLIFIVLSTFILISCNKVDNGYLNLDSTEYTSIDILALPSPPSTFTITDNKDIKTIVSFINSLEIPTTDIAMLDTDIKGGIKYTLTFNCDNPFKIDIGENEIRVSTQQKLVSISPEKFDEFEDIFNTITEKLDTLNFYLSSEYFNKKISDKPILQITNAEDISLFNNLINNGTKMDGIFDMLAPPLIAEFTRNGAIERIYLGFYYQDTKKGALEGFYLKESNTSECYTTKYEDIKKLTDKFPILMTENNNRFDVTMLTRELDNLNYKYDIKDIDSDMLSDKAKSISLGNDTLTIYEFNNYTEMMESSNGIDTYGSTVKCGNTESKIEWISTPHWFRRGSIIILYVGDNTELIKTLESIVTPQFAGN